MARGDVGSVTKCMLLPLLPPAPPPLPPPPPPPLMLEAAAAEAVAPVCAAGDGAEPSSPLALRPKQHTIDMEKVDCVNSQQQPHAQSRRFFETLPTISTQSRHNLDTGPRTPIMKRTALSSC